ncbi:MAG: Crp/Fnr family transcriptional regulator [Chloroflexota bacterium]
MELKPSDLRRVNVLEQSSDEDLAHLLNNAVLRPIEEGEFFFLQGDPATHFYILVSGKAKLCQISKNGQTTNLRTINEWQVFGAVGTVRERAVYPACAQALEHSVALAVESRILHEMMETRPHLSFGLMQLMTGYIAELQERYRELATERVEQRIARAILRLVRQIGQQSGDAASPLELNLSHQDLAEATGTTIYTVSRTLSEWERREIVKAGRERVVIRDLHGLMELAEGTGQ